MQFDDPYKYMMSGYYGIELLDEYKDKLYLLKDIRNYIDSYLEDNRVPDFDYEALNREIERNNSDLDKLQDALLLLKDMKGPMEAVLLIKQKVAELKKNR
ncbi:MAG: hypothetical protein K5666_03105 [Bacilli bacterium]|nr:hypothetical protein [Bacilli bacterium]